MNGEPAKSSATSLTGSKGCSTTSTAAGKSSFASRIVMRISGEQAKHSAATSRHCRRYSESGYSSPFTTSGKKPKQAGNSNTAPRFPSRTSFQAEMLKSFFLFPSERVKYKKFHFCIFERAPETKVQY